MASAAPKRARANFWEVLVEGQPEHCHGLLQGLVLGAGEGITLLFSHDVGIRTPLGDRMLRLMHVHATVCHVVVNSAGRTLFRARRKALEEHGVRVLEERRIKSGSFQYAYHAYARQYADEVRKLLDSLPKSLKRSGDAPKETIDESARGVEAYSAVHDYEIEAEGTVSGKAIDALAEARRRLDEHPLVKTQPIELELV